MRRRGKVARKDQEIFGPFGPTQENHNRVIGVMKINPLESLVGEIHLVQRGLAAIQSIDSGTKALELLVNREL